MWPSCRLGLASPALCNGTTQSPDNRLWKDEHSATTVCEDMSSTYGTLALLGTVHLLSPNPVERIQSLLSLTLSQRKVTLSSSHLLRRLGPFSFRFPHQNLARISLLPQVWHTPHPLIWSLEYLASANHETRHYVLFSSPHLPYPSSVQARSSAFSFWIPSVYVLLLTQESKIHTTL